MKTVEPPTGPLEGEWSSSQTGDPLPASSAHAPVPSPGSSTDRLGSELPDNDPTRVFLHQLSQTLTSLRGTLELALLVDSDAQDYRRVIQQSLVQAECLVQLFNSYRTLVQRANYPPGEQLKRKGRADSDGT